MKLCKDCEHFRYECDKPGGMFPPMPDRYLCYGDPVRSLIDGSVRLSDARKERASVSDDNCGKDGLWFKTKAPPKPEWPPNRVIREGESTHGVASVRAGGGYRCTREAGHSGPCAAVRRQPWWAFWRTK